MDLEDIQHLTDAEKDRYLKLERLFDSDGWKLVEEWATQQRENATARLVSATNWDQHRLLTGARLVYAELEGLRETTESTFAQLASANKDAKLAEAEENFE